MPDPCIIALGGGGFSMEPTNPKLDEYILSLSGKAHPKVCFVPTASGDSDDYIVRFYDAFTVERSQPSHLRLFSRKVQDLRGFLLNQDVIYVGGGATASLLAVWRLHGLDVILREAWERGIILSGISAGALCWFEAGITDSFGKPLQSLHDGLKFLSGSFCPHYDGETERRPIFQRMIGDGTIPPGLAADDGVALVYTGTTFTGAVSSRPNARAWQVERTPDGARESEIAPRVL
jgi:dipeptidase E